MAFMFARTFSLTLTALLLLGATACAGNAEPQSEAHLESSEAPSGSEAGTDASETAPTTGSLADAQGDIPWPTTMTLPTRDGVSFDQIENHYACDGTLLAVLVSSPDATEQSTRDYLESIQDLFAVPGDVRQGHGQDSIRDSDTGGMKAEGQIQDHPSAMDATKIVGWESLDAGGYRFHLQETAKPGIPVHVENTPAESWSDFPHPEAATFEDCDARESSGYRDGTGFTPASTTWTLTGSPVIQPEVQTWMEGLASEGWDVEENPAMEGAGMPEAVLTSDTHTLHYAMSGDYLTLFVSDRNLDKFLGL